MSSAVRICIVSPGFPRWPGDFTHPMVWNLGRLLLQAGYAVRVVTPHYPGTRTREVMDGIEVRRFRYAWPERLEVLGSEGGILDDIRRSPAAKFMLPFFLLGFALAALRHGRGCAFFLVQWVPTALTVLPARLLQGKRLFINSRTYPDTPLWRRVYGAALRRCDGVVFNSRDNQRATGEVFAHPRSTVIGSGIDPEQFHRPAGHPRPSQADGVPRIVLVGRCVEFKGIEYAVRAMPLILARRPAILEVYGDGPLLPGLRSLAGELGVGHAVNFHGQVRHDDVPRAMWSGDLFLIPSIVDSLGRTEGFGAVVLEAMCAGLPVVASRVGGIVDIVSKERGVLVAEKDPGQIADAVLSLLDDPARAAELATRGQEFARENFSPQAMLLQYLEFFKGIDPALVPDRPHEALA